MIPQETVDLILDTARIEEVVGDFLTLKRRGASYVACCPFHNEKTPSFYVTPSKGIYKCFGCGKAGTAVGFVMEHEHCTYVEALKYLAQRYHIEIQEEELSAEEIASRQKRESLLLVTEFAEKFFVEQLDTPEGKAVARAYYRSRGLLDETVAKFGLGWAPSGRRALTDAALAAGYKEDYLIEAGLAVRHDDGSLSDRFRERVMFPIHSVSGRVIAFSGRTLKSDNPAKYVNSPETEIYTKSKSLLGIFAAKTEISRRDRCILVEGNVDVITMQQLGIPNVVASCGTSLTVEQIRLISKFTQNLTIMYDGDKAGIHAAIRGIDMVLAEGMNVHIVLLPDGDDPDSFGRKHTLAEVEEFIGTHSQDFISFKTDLLLEDAAGDPLKKANLINDIADTIAQIPDAVKRSVYAAATAKKFEIDEKILVTRVDRTRRAMREEADRERKRANRSAEADEVLIPVEEPYDEHFTAPQAAPKIYLENKILAPIEGDILCFLLQYGRSPLKFETDSKYYTEEPQTVCDFIRAAIESDGSTLVNSIYRRVYDAYVLAYSEGLDQESAVRRILDSPDRELAQAAAEFAFEKYQLSVEKLSASLMSEDSWLVTYVPATVLQFASKRVQCEIKRLSADLAASQDMEEQDSLLQQIAAYQIVLKNIKKLK